MKTTKDRSKVNEVKKEVDDDGGGGGGIGGVKKIKFS